jgi:hypothetical protein
MDICHTGGQSVLGKEGVLNIAMPWNYYHYYYGSAALCWTLAAYLVS